MWQTLAKVLLLVNQAIIFHHRKKKRSRKKYKTLFINNQDQIKIIKSANLLLRKKTMTVQMIMNTSNAGKLSIKITVLKNLLKYLKYYFNWVNRKIRANNRNGYNNSSFWKTRFNIIINFFYINSVFSTN